MLHDHHWPMSRKYLVVIGLLTWPCLTAGAAETVAPNRIGSYAASTHSVRPLQGAVPPSTQHLTQPLDHAIATYHSREDLEQQIKHLRVQRDSVNTELTSLGNELELVEGYRTQRRKQLIQTEGQHVEELELLRSDLENRLREELLQTEQQVAAELQQDASRRLRFFEIRQQDSIRRGLDRELDLEMRELDHLAKEVDVEVLQLLDRLARLGVKRKPAESLEHSMRQVLQQRKEELLARRQRLEAERDALLAEQRQTFVDNLEEARTATHRHRMTMKEASLRQAMAELLHKTRGEASEEIARLRKTRDKLEQQYRQLTDRQARLEARLRTLDHELASSIDRAESTRGAWDKAVAQLELALDQTDLIAQPEVMTWFDRAIQFLEPELAVELKPLPQRALAKAEQQRKLEERQRLLRERQLAVQLSQEMEQQRQQMRVRRQRAQEVKAKQAERLIAKAERLVSRSAFDKALEVLGGVDGIHPPEAQRHRAELAREEILAAKEQAVRQTRTDELDRLFNHAMKAFHQGRFQQAITLFEQVVVLEGSSEQAKTAEAMMAGVTP